MAVESVDARLSTSALDVTAFLVPECACAKIFRVKILLEEVSIRREVQTR